MSKLKLALLLWQHRRPIAAVVLTLLAIPVGLATVLAAALASVPLVSDQQIALYAVAAERLPASGIGWEQMIAIDAVRFKQDFAKVTPETIRETAWMFVACGSDDHVEELHYHLPRAWATIMHPVTIGVPSTVSWTLHISEGAPGVTLVNGQDEVVATSSVDPGRYFLRIMPLVPDTRFHLVLTVSPLDLACEGRPLDEVMDQLGFDPTQREMARNMMLAFDEAGQSEFSPKGPYEWPVPGHHTISGPFGVRISPLPPYRVQKHNGVDIPATEGAPIVAAADGEVVHAGSDVGYGLLVRIDHGGFITAYAHLSELSVRDGQTVKQGQRIGLVGSTGSSTGTHLHFEWWERGRHVGPLGKYR